MWIVTKKIADLQASVQKSLMLMPGEGGMLTLITPVNPTGPTMLDITYDAKKDAMAKEAIEYANFKLKMVMEKRK